MYKAGELRLINFEFSEVKKNIRW